MISRAFVFILKQINYTHRHFISSLDVEHQVLNKGDLVQVWYDPKTWGPTSAQFDFPVQLTFAGDRFSCCTLVWGSSTPSIVFFTSLQYLRPSSALASAGRWRWRPPAGGPTARPQPLWHTWGYRTLRASSPWCSECVWTSPLWPPVETGHDRQNKERSVQRLTSFYMIRALDLEPTW